MRRSSAASSRARSVAPSGRASSPWSWPTSSPRRWRTTRWPPSRASTCRTTTASSCRREDREQFASYEPALRKELSDYLLEHARQESFSLSTRPQVEFHTDERLDLGEFGIQAQLLASPEEELEEPQGPETPAPSAGDFGHTMVYSPSREARRLDPVDDRRQALLVGSGRRNVLSGSRVVIGRSREADIVLQDPNISRRHAELRRDEEGWQIVDLGSTNGIKVNGRRVDRQPLSPGDEITIGVTDLSFELD